MFVRKLADVEAVGRLEVQWNATVRSARYLTVADGMGFSLHDNRVTPGEVISVWYKNHWEANYIISGRVKIVDLDHDGEWTLGPGDLYQVGPNDRHTFDALEDEHHLSILCPALRGDERHDADGAYEASGPVPVTDRRMFLRSADEMRASGKEMIVANGEGRTLRMLTKADALGFSISDVHFDAGHSALLWYKHHWEANYIVSGRGRVEDLGTGESWALEPGILYNVGPKDRHRLSAEAAMHLVSVFCPPLVGHEQHDADGALEPSGPVSTGPPGY